MKLFDNFDRHYKGPAKYAEPAFSYLNRSARPVVGSVRDVLEDWFSHYPVPEQADLRGRFRSKDDPHHHSAFFELFLHELLLSLGCEVRIHPSVEKPVTERPDFEVFSAKGDRFYVEATVATDESEQDAAARARMNVVYDALNQLDSPDFFVGMNIEGTPDTQPKARSIRAFLKRRLTQLEPEELADLWKSEGFDRIPH